MKGIRLASVTGTRNLDSPDDRYILRIEAAGFCRASDDASRRITRNLEAKAERGLPRSGGARAYGFERDNLTHRLAETRYIAEAAERMLAGEETYSTYRWMLANSATATGGRWRYNTFRGVMASPRIAGILERNGQWSKGAWEPIVEPEAWLDLRALMEERGKMTARYGKPRSAPKVKYMCSGTARCGTCKGPLTGRGKRAAPDYSCCNESCEYRVCRSMPMLDAYMSGRVVQTLNDPQFIAALFADGDGDTTTAAEIATLVRRKEAAEKQILSLADNPEIDLALALKSLASFDQKINALRGARLAGTRRRLLAKHVGITLEQWNAEPLDVRRATLGALFKVEVLKGAKGRNGFNPDLVKATLIED
jgi:hypothetical protein